MTEGDGREMDNRSFYTEFYSQPHDVTELLYQMSFAFVNSNLFPVLFTVTIDDELKTRLTFFAYEQRQASFVRDLYKFEKAKKEIDLLIHEQTFDIDAKLLSVNKDLTDLTIVLNQAVINETIRDYIKLKDVYLQKDTALHKQGKSIANYSFYTVNPNNTREVALNRHIKLDKRKPFSLPNLYSYNRISEHDVFYISRLISSEYKDPARAILLNNSFVVDRVNLYEVLSLPALKADLFTKRYGLIIPHDPQMTHKPIINLSRLQFAESMREVVGSLLSNFLQTHEYVAKEFNLFKFNSVDPSAFDASILSKDIISEDNLKSVYLMIVDKVIYDFNNEITLTGQASLISDLEEIITMVLNKTLNRSNLDTSFELLITPFDKDARDTDLEARVVTMIRDLRDTQKVDFILHTQRTLRSIMLNKIKFGEYSPKDTKVISDLILINSLYKVATSQANIPSMTTNPRVADVITHNLLADNVSREFVTSVYSIFDRIVMEGGIVSRIDFVAKEYRDIYSEDYFKLVDRDFRDSFIPNEPSQSDRSVYEAKRVSNLNEIDRVARDVDRVSRLEDVDRALHEIDRVSRSEQLDQIARDVDRVSRIEDFDKLGKGSSYIDDDETLVDKISKDASLQDYEALGKREKDSGVVHHDTAYPFQQERFEVSINHDFEFDRKSERDSTIQSEIKQADFYSTRPMEIHSGPKSIESSKKSIISTDKQILVPGRQRETIVSIPNKEFERVSKGAYVFSLDEWQKLSEYDWFKLSDLIGAEVGGKLGEIKSKIVGVVKPKEVDLNHSHHNLMEPQKYVDLVEIFIALKKEKEVYINTGLTIEKAEHITELSQLHTIEKELLMTYEEGLRQIDTIRKEIKLPDMIGVTSQNSISVFPSISHFETLRYIDLTTLNRLHTSPKDVIIYSEGHRAFNRLHEVLLLDEFIFTEMYRRWYFITDDTAEDGPYDWMILPGDFPYSLHPEFNIPVHPFPFGGNEALREIPVSVKKIENVIQFGYQLWNSHLGLYSRLTPEQALKHFVNLFYDWLKKYLPEKIYRMPEYYPDDTHDSRVILNNLNKYPEEYWRIYRWIRWYAEAFVLNIPEDDKTKLLGNMYIKRLLDDLVKYFDDHHGKFYGPDVPKISIINKVKGKRHLWLKHNGTKS